MRIKSVLAIAAFTGALSAAATSPRAQAPPQGPPPVLTESLAGSDSFARYCAPCHGTSGRGDGPVAAALKTRPADLTALARRNDGAFPQARVRDFVAGVGRTPAAHGSTEMPIWGPLFRAFESDARAQVRLDNLVAHVASLQAPSTGVNDPGSQLFRAHCATCHGSDARGSGPLAEQMRRQPPDLTTFAQRNGGVFPAERVRRIVDGRDVASHGDRDMPVWGDAFRRRGLSDQDAAARVEAIVGYLGRIQARGTH